MNGESSCSQEALVTFMAAPLPALSAYCGVLQELLPPDDIGLDDSTLLATLLSRNNVDHKRPAPWVLVFFSSL